MNSTAILVSVLMIGCFSAGALAGFLLHNIAVLQSKDAVGYGALQQACIDSHGTYSASKTASLNQSKYATSVIVCLLKNGTGIQVPLCENITKNYTLKPVYCTGSITLP